jgi:hypothetical protein
MASAGEEKNSTFLLAGFFALQAGRQKIPVVFTPVKKTPSNEGSLARKARNITLSGGRGDCVFNLEFGISTSFCELKKEKVVEKSTEKQAWNSLP